MNVIVEHEALTNPAVAGNKAAALAELLRAGFDVPPFFVIRGQALAKQAGDAVARQVAAAIESLSFNSKSLAVRSSSVEEDGSAASFAGQFDTCLHVAPGDVVDAALRVASSGASRHLAAYRDSRGLAAVGQAPAVLVQRMVSADAAGVAFAVDPVSGNASQAVVAAVAGVGDSLVSGERQGDTWRVGSFGRIDSVELEGDVPVLSRRDVRRVARLVRKVSRSRGRPQDIEWAIENGRLYLLQSRDITAVQASGADAAVRVWDNSNIVESYGGVTTPLTFSVARTAYAEAYRTLGRAIGVDGDTIEAHHDTYEQMIGLIDGRVYYNLQSWYRLLMLVPGFRHNRRFMEQMMGVADELPPGTLPSIPSARPLDRFRSIAGLAKVGLRLAVRLAVHDRAVRRFHARIDDLLQPVDLGTMSLESLADHFDTLQAGAIAAWDAPLLNDLYCMVFHGLLRRLCESWLPAEMAGIHNELVAGGAGIISMEPVRCMKQLAGMARKDEAFRTLLADGDAAEIAGAIRSRPEFAQVYEAYVDRFGDRCLDELKLESRTLADDPLPFLRTVGQLAAQPPAADGTDQVVRPEEADVSRTIRGRFRQRVFRRVLGLARARVRDRENMRFERTRVYGRVRALFVEVGRRFAETGVLADRDEIFYLTAGEILGAIRGTAACGVPGKIATARRAEFEDYRRQPGPPRRFLTDGPPQLPGARRAVADEADVGGECRSGQACSRGVIRGRVRIVTEPRDAVIEQGEILVAERTDPGWVTIFPLVSGMIMERGSLLSHSAIVARELGIPAVVGVENACRWLRDGDIVELDGATGSIRRLQSAGESE